MAGGIKGITVKIGGDTTELGRSLTEATNKSTALQRELKGVNSLLKMDPSNVTLLTQKSDLLKKSIEETRNKLNDLVEVQKKVDSGEIEMTEAEYRNLQREIASTEIKLKSLTEESKQFGSVGAQQVSQFGEKMKDTGSKVEDVGKKLSALSAVSGAVLGGSVMAASNYEDALAKVNTIADTSKVSLSDLSDQIMDLSNQTGISANDIADATYNAISAGQDTADAVTFVSNATALAKAGFTDTGSAIGVLTTIMNAYGLEADKVGSVSDMLIQTQNKGKTTVAELSSTMGKVIPTANAMGVGLDQLCASYSILTANGIATAESTTYMNSMLNELGKGGTKVSDALKKKTGKSFQDLMKDGNSLGDVLQIIKEYADDTGVGFNDLWSSSEAGRAGLTLLSEGAGAFNDAVSGMNNSVGATTEAFDKMQTPSQKATIAINQLKNAGVTLGQTALSSLAPLIDKVAIAIQNLAQWFSNLSPGTQQIILLVLGITAALGPALIVIGKLISSVGTIMTFAPQILTFVKTIGTGLNGLWGIIAANPVIAVVTAVIGIIVLLYTKCEWFRNGVNAVINSVVNYFKNLYENARQIFANIGNAISSAWNNIKNTTSNVWNSISNYVFTVFNAIKSGVSNGVNTVKNTVSSVWNAIKSVTTSVWNSIKNAITNPIETAKNTVSNTINGIRNTVRNIFNGIKPKLNLSLPRISVSGGKAPWGIGGKGYLPSFNVRWNKLGAIFKKPTIFDTRLGYQGVGEDGPEAVAPISELMKYVTMAVDNGNIADRMDRLETVVSNGFANMSRGAQIVLDTGVLVGETIDMIDAGLATNQSLKLRGV